MIDSPFAFQKKRSPGISSTGQSGLGHGGDGLKALAQLEGSRPHSPEWTQVLSGEAASPDACRSCGALGHEVTTR